ncbi:MAG: 50S ribosomal protein L23 [Bacteriovoracaceae bacterium]
MTKLVDVLLRPLITEKSSMAAESFNRFGFEVALNSNKYQIKDAVEKLYAVKVLNVKTSIAPGKSKRFGMYSKKTNKTKKAFVQLAEGQKIEFFKGV